MPREETRAEQLVYRWCFAAVYVGAIAGVASLWRTSGTDAVSELGALAATSVLLVGKFIIFAPLRDEVTLGPWAMALMVWLIDLLLAFALASGLESFEQAPVLGRWLRRARGRALVVLTEYPRLERMAFFGVVLFVLLPLAATGAVTGSIAARMLGLTRTAGLLAIAVGSAGTASIFALLAAFLGERAEEILRSPTLAGAMILGFAIFARFAYRKVKALLKE